jgi:hypothetical protein
MDKMKLYKDWTKHLKDNNMTYCEHLKFAVGHGLVGLEAGLLLIIHGFFPFFFEEAGTLLIRKLNESFDQYRKSRNCNNGRTEL